MLIVSIFSFICLEISHLKIRNIITPLKTEYIPVNTKKDLNDGIKITGKNNKISRIPTIIVYLIKSHIHDHSDIFIFLLSNLNIINTTKIFHTQLIIKLTIIKAGKKTPKKSSTAIPASALTMGKDRTIPKIKI